MARFSGLVMACGERRSGLVAPSTASSMEGITAVWSRCLQEPAARQWERRMGHRVPECVPPVSSPCARTWGWQGGGGGGRPAVFQF